MPRAAARLADPGTALGGTSAPAPTATVAVAVDEAVPLLHAALDEVAP